MLVQQFIHQLNNTELGRTGTHDCYAYVSRDTAPLITFLDAGSRYTFVYKRNPSVSGELFYTHTSTGEFRVSGCKKFYDAGSVNAGDCIVLERVGENFWVDFVKRSDVIVFNKMKDKWQCRNEDRLGSYLDIEVPTLYENVAGKLLVKYVGETTKRTQTVKAYSLLFDGHEILNGDVYNLLTVGGISCLTSVFKDKVTTIEWSDHE